MRVGIFDSGNGGLSVLLEALRRLPDTDFIFYGDTLHVPYGEKTEQEVLSFVDEAVEFLENEGVDAVVLACNTATSVAAELLRKKYSFPIIGMEPAAKLALDYDHQKRTMVIATPITVRGEKLKALIGKYDNHHLVDTHAMPGLVRLAESDIYKGPEVENYLKQELGSYSWEEYSSLVLGCTHFNYFKKALRQVVPPSVVFLDGNEGTVEQLSRKLGLGTLEDCGDKVAGEDAAFDLEAAMKRVKFYYSGRAVDEPEELVSFLHRLEHLRQMRLVK